MTDMATVGFAAFMGVAPAVDGDGGLCLMMPGDAAMGRPGAMHGGATATLLEQAGRRAVIAALEAGTLPTIDLASMTVDYLRVGPMAPSRARGTIVKLGARVAVVTAAAWVDEPAKPYAMAKLTFLLTR